MTSKSNPTPRARRRARNDLLGTAVGSENIKPQALQVKAPVARFGLASVHAELVARLAWGARP
jgi:hypothetical protein